MSILTLPEWLPKTAHIVSYQIDSQEESDLLSVLSKISEKHEGIISEELNSLNYNIGSILIHVRWINYDGNRIIVMAAGSKYKEKSLNHIPIYSKYDEQLQKTLEVLPDKPSSIYQLKFIYSIEEKNLENTLHKFLEKHKRSLISAGYVQNSLIATLNAQTDTPFYPSTREILILPYQNIATSLRNVVWDLCMEISHIASHIEEINKYYNERKLMFDQMDASESSTQIRINEILAEIRRPVDEIQPADLESILKEISIQYSRLSTLSSTIRRDRVKAQSTFRKLKTLYKAWNERPFEGYLSNSMVELDHCESLIASFGDFIERTEALMVQFNTVLDSVRTYLGIKQQKMSITEEKSSKEQLIRLVNLQEILHKLEILIVAVYLTEIAKIFFEAVIHEHVNLLTALFIPIALLISILIARFLHKNH